jgi:hypothetical protein
MARDSDPREEYLIEADGEGMPVLDEPVTADESEALPPQHDHPLAVEEFGVTAAEARVPEPLDRFVRREEPDFGRRRRRQGDDLHNVAPGVGRLVDDGDVDEFDFVDKEPELLGRLSDDGEGALSAEEAAIHIIEP